MWTENFYIGDNLSLWSFWANPNSISSICESVICRQDETAVRTVCFLEKKQCITSKRDLVQPVGFAPGATGPIF